MSLRPDDHRRKWDRAQYERLAQDRLRAKGRTEDELEDDDSKGIIFFMWV